MSSSGDPLFQLECVLLFALDVVKGPYIHSCAPANPSELIRSFLQPPAAAAAAGSCSPHTSHVIPSRPPGSPLRRYDVGAEEGGQRLAGLSGGGARRTSGGGSALLNTSPPLGACGLTVSSSSPLAYGNPPPASAGCPSPTIAGQATPFTGPSSLATVARSGSSITATAIPNTLAATAASERVSASSFTAQRRLLGLVDAATPDEARGIAMGTSAFNNASASENTTVFAVSPQTNLSESQQTLPSVSPMAGSFAGVTNASMTSNAGGVGFGDAGAGSNSASAAATAALRCATPGPGMGDAGGGDASAAASWMARFPGSDDEAGISGGGGGLGGHALPPARASLVSATVLSPPPADAAAADVAGRSAPSALRGSFALDSSTAAAAAASSPLASSLHTPPITATFPAPTPAAETHQHQLRSHYGTAGGSRGGYAAAAGAGAAATNTAAGATEDGKINSYNDVFVPRSEFCRRVLWLYPAESGLLFLYYAEDIPGEHYQRKTLRYSLCLVFRVDEKRMTIGAGLLHQLVRPYSVVLTNIAEELREAEVKYGYMSRGLQAVATPRRPPPPPPPPLPQHQQQQQQQQNDPSSFSSAGSAATQPMTATSTVVVDISAAVTRETSETAEDEEDGTGPQTDTTSTSAAATAAAASSASSAQQQRSFRMGRRRVLNESSARPDTYHLALVERSTPAPLATKVTDASTVAATAAVSELSDQTPTSYMSPLPPNTSGSDASAATGRGEAAAAPAEGDAVAKQSTVEKVKSSESATAAAMTATGTEGTSGSPSYVATSRTTTGTTPSSQFGTPFSPAAPESGATTRGGGGGAEPHLPSGSGSDGNTARTVAAAAAAAAAGGAAESSSVSAISPSLTDAEAVTVTPPSSLPLRSRTVSQGTGGFQMSSPAFGDSLSTATTATTAPSPLSCLVGPNGPGGVAGPFPSAAGLHVTRCPTHPAATASAPHHHHHHYGSSSSPTGTHRGAGSAEGGYAHVSHAVHTLNAFITPTTAPQWTPLSELVEELYRCLRYGGSGEDDGDGSAVTTGASTSAAAAAAAAATATVAVSSPGSLSGRLSGGSLSTSAVLRPQQSPNGVAAARHGAASRWPSVPSPLGRAQPQPPMQQQQQQQPQQRAGTRQLYSPLTTRLPGGGRESSWVLGGGAEEGGEVAQAEGRAEACSAGAAAAAHFPRTPIAMAPPQRGDVSVVHLSDRLSFHVRRMAPLQAARMIDFAHVPVPIVPYDPTMVEWMDMAVHHVFRLVDGVRTVADLVFGVAMGTTTTLAEVYADALRRSKQLAQAAAVAGQAATTDLSEERQGAKPVVAGSAGSRDKTSSRGSSVGGRAGAKRVAPQPASRAAAAATAAEEQRTTQKSAQAPQHRPRAIAVPIDARPSLTLLPGVRYSMPTSAAAAAAAAAISDGQAQLPSHVNVRVAPTTPEPASDAAATAGSASLPAPGATGTLSAVGKGGGATTSPSPPPPSISVELSATWVATTGIVVEALLHLELCHLLKIYRPWTGSTLYSATLTLQRLLRNGRHPARQVLAQHLLHVAWVERQQLRRERQAQRKAAAEALKSQREEQREAQQQPQAEGEGSDGIVPPLQSSAAEAPPTAPLSTPGPAALGPSLPSPSLSPPLSSKAGVLHGAAASASSTGKAPAAVSQSPSDRVSWLPAAVTVPAPSSSSSAPRPGSYSDAHAGPVQPRQVPHAHLYQTSPSVLSSGASSLRRPPPTGSGSGGGGVESGSNVNTHASSMSTSYALSCSLKHSVSVGVTGKLQMNLISSLPTSPMLRPSAASMGGVNSGAVAAAQRLPGSHTAARGLVDGLPSPADPSYGASLSLPPGRHLHHHHGGGGSLSTSSETTSSTSSTSGTSTSTSSRSSSERSSSEVGGGEQARSAAVAATSRAGQRPSPPSSARSRSATSERNASRPASSPVSFKPTSSLHGSRHSSHHQHHHVRRSGSAHSSASTTLTSSSSSTSSSANRRTGSTDLPPHSLPTLLVTSAPSPPETAHDNAALHTTDAAAAAAAAFSASSKLVSSSVLSGQEAPESSAAAAAALREVGARMERGAAGVVREGDTAAASASASDPQSRAGRVKLGSTFSASRPQTDPTSGGPESSSEVRKRRKSKPLRRDAALRVFVPADAELAQAAAAALCALAKFGNTTVSSVQAEMRRMPVWAPSFNHWSDRCVHALVEVAVLNNWLEDVSP